jgi:hypothetical protein
LQPIGVVIALTTSTLSNAITREAFMKYHLQVLVLILYSFGFCAEPKPLGVARIRLLPGSMISIPVLIDGSGPFDFLLDTGTQTTLIAPGIARRLGLKDAGLVILHTANGEKPFIRSFLPKISVAGLDVTQMEVLEDTPEAPDSSGSKPAGVLGQNFLSQFNVLLNYRQKSVSFFPGSESYSPIPGVRIPLSISHGQPVVTIDSATGSALHLVLDSAANFLVLHRGDLPGFRSCDFAPCRSTMQTAVTNSTVLQGRMMGLHAGNIVLPELQAFVANQRSTDDPIDGLLPASLFPEIYINYHDDWVVIGH